MFATDYFEQNKNKVGVFSFCYLLEQEKEKLPYSALKDDYSPSSFDAKPNSGPHACLLVEQDMMLQFENSEDVRVVKKGSIIYRGANGLEVIDSEHIGNNIFITYLKIGSGRPQIRRSRKMRDFYFN